MSLARSPAFSVGAGVTLAAVNAVDNEGDNKYTTCEEREDTFCAEHLRDKEEEQRHLRRKFLMSRCGLCHVTRGISCGNVFSFLLRTK